MANISFKKIIKKVEINSQEVADTQTGEIFDLKNMNLVDFQSADYINIDSKTYFYVDTNDLFALILKGITHAELGLLIILATSIQSGSNICMLNKDDPHSTKTIAKLVNCSVQSVKGKINRLIKLDALFYGVVPEQKRLRKVYVINPHVLRMGRKFNKSLATIFNPI